VKYELVESLMKDEYRSALGIEYLRYRRFERENPAVG